MAALRPRVALGLTLLAACALLAPAQLDDMVQMAADGPADPNAAATPQPSAFQAWPGGKGAWSSGHRTGHVMIHTVLMKDGDVVAWSPWTDGYAASVYNPVTKRAKQLLGRCGIHACKNAFCAAQVSTASNDILIFGGHSQDTQWFRHYDHDSGKLVSSRHMTSNRWYPGACTLPDGKILVVGGVKQSGAAGYAARDHSKDNPSYEIYDPASKRFGGDKFDMKAQLSSAFPVHTYPICVVTPDGGVTIAAGKTLAKYKRSGAFTFAKQFNFKNSPHTPRSYPQTGTGMLLPMAPPYNRAFYMATGGSSRDRASSTTAASSAAHVIELTGGAGANWRSVGPMPYPRVMGDALTLCDGTVVIMNGLGKGVGGWATGLQQIKYRDGGGYRCTKKCPKGSGFVFEPVMYDPETEQWSKKGSLSMAMRPRGYHSVALLTPDCKVMVSGSDVTNDFTAEFWTPPYLSKGPRPVITAAPGTIRAGDTINLRYKSAAPVVKALLLRTGSVTHSQHFDERALWLDIVANGGGAIKLATPKSNVLPPGMYMVTLLSDAGVPSVAKIMSVN